MNYGWNVTKYGSKLKYLCEMVNFLLGGGEFSIGVVNFGISGLNLVMEGGELRAMMYNPEKKYKLNKK